jgi:hypothetical protein
MITLAGSMMPDELRLYVGAGYLGTPIPTGIWPGSSGILSQTDGGVGLRAGPRDTGTLVDAISYGKVVDGHPFTELHPVPVMANGRSASRLPFDGKDDGDNSTDFLIAATATPGARNAP